MKIETAPVLILYDDRDVYQIDAILEWEYLIDVLSIEVVAHVKVADVEVAEGKTLLQVVKAGLKARFALSNPRVNGGTPTTKVQGRVVEFRDDISPQNGATIEITISNAGWHLARSAAPLHVQLRGLDWKDAINPNGGSGSLLDPTWGLGEPLFNGKLRTELAQGRLKQGAAFEATVDLQGPDAIVYVQTEPGQTVAEVLAPFAQREGLLMGVTADQRLVFFKPNDRTAAVYQITLRKVQTEENNVLSTRRMVDAAGQATECSVVGDLTLPDDTDVGNTDPNFAHVVGTVTSSVLPFMHRQTASDADRRSKTKAKAQAQWLMDRGIFDSVSIEYDLPGHEQDGDWFEPDQTVHVIDEFRDIREIMYLCACHYFGSKVDGEHTVLTVRKTGLLSGGVKQ